MKTSNLLSIFFVFFFFFSCNTSGEDVKMEPVSSIWTNKKKVKIPFDNKDQDTKNIIFVTRNNNMYPYSNLRLFVELKDSKNKVIKKDTLNLVLAKPSGEWLGSGFGDTKELRFLYKTNYKFPEIGKYSAEISHAMRKDSLTGIEDIGIITETYKP